MNNRRLGKFKMSGLLVEKDCATVATTLARMGFVPTRCEFLYSEKAFVYEGISHLFDEVQSGEEIPYYDIRASKTRTGYVDYISVERVTSPTW